LAQIYTDFWSYGDDRITGNENLGFATPEAAEKEQRKIIGLCKGHRI
jgi:hypothetical protein